MNQLLGVGALIDRSWDHYVNHFGSLIKISAWMLTVAAINIIAIGLYPVNALELTRSLNGWEIFGIILFIINNLVLAVIVGIWVVNALITAIHTQSSGKRLTTAQIHKQGWKLFLPQLLVRIYIIAIFILSLAIPVFLFWLIDIAISSFIPHILLLLILFAIMLLLLPPFTLLIYLAFSLFALIIDGKTGVAAITESASLVKGRFWAVFTRLAIPKLLYFIVFFIAQFLMIIIFKVLLFGFMGDTTDSMLFTRASMLILPTSYTILFILLNPLLLITDHEIYKNLKS